MHRRDFITLLCSAAVVWPLAARSQQPTKTKRIALVVPAVKAFDRADPNSVVFFEELKRLGYVEGTNLIIDHLTG